MLYICIVIKTEVNKLLKIKNYYYECYYEFDLYDR